MTEADLQAQLALYLATRYPDVQFHSDFGSGVKLRPYQAKMQKKQNAGRRGWPDLFIAEPRNGYAGLFLELKREGKRIQKRNGDWTSDHIATQAEVIKELLKKGYYAQFAIGFEEAKKLIDDYLGENK